jgi:amino acid adenylation domain-containing protein
MDMPLPSPRTSPGASPGASIDGPEASANDDRSCPAVAHGREPTSDAPDPVAVIARRALDRPAHPAVEAPDATLSYADLERLSNQLARRLISLGVGPDACVGISLPRGAAELVAMLATAKAGGAYVPLDPSHPADRLQIVLEDAAPQVLIVHPSSPLVASSPLGAARAMASVIVLDDLARATDGYDATPPAIAYDQAELAYVLFTSGSTGRPKGVEISRGAFANFLRSMTHEPGLSERDRLLAVSTTSFDIAGLELLLPLYVGATVVIADRATVVDPRQLRRRLESDGITIMQATPATWRLLLEAGWRGHDQLRMLCGGEAMSGALADRLLAGGGELWNMYGPTETTVWSSLQRIRAGYGLITIGKPIDRTQIYVLDPERRLLQSGAIGELYIGGAGLARGYRGRPDLTAERFVQNPHGPVGDRIYRTGDLGRMLPDGRFECLGRIDHQVKIRGFRIELGEIESVLRQVAGVKEVLVVAEPQELEGDPRLCAYWVGEAGREAILEGARRRLPAYMVPSGYVHLDAFPLNTNGKIDRKALPRSAAFRQELPLLKRPRNDAETRIAALWCQVLGLDQVGVDQSFFTLGGTSVLAIALRARIEKEVGVEIPMSAFFESPTVERLAAHLGAGGESSSGDAPIVVELRRGAAGLEPLHCLLGVHLYQDLALVLAGDRPVIGMHLPFRHRPGAQHRPSIAEMAAGYLKLIRQRQPHGPYHLAGLCFGGIVAFEAARHLEAQGETVALVAVFDGMLPSAVRVNQVDRLRGILRDAVKEPRRFPSFLRHKLSGMLARVPWLRELSGWRRMVPGCGVTRTTPLVDVSIEGVEADAEVCRFASNVTGIAGRLLIIRAAAEILPSWIELAPHLGWQGLSNRLVTRDVATTHLDLLREPHVRTVAVAMAEALWSEEVASGAEEKLAVAG